MKGSANLKTFASLCVISNGAVSGTVERGNELMELSLCALSITL